jgi:hypothetical protein
MSETDVRRTLRSIDTIAKSSKSSSGEYKFQEFVFETLDEKDA